MKKKIAGSVIVSVVISIILMIFNRIYAVITGHIIGLTIPGGGDCVGRIGLGWHELTLYPEMTVEEAAAWQPEISIQFDIWSFVFTFLIVFVVTLVINIIKSRKRL